MKYNVERLLDLIIEENETEAEYTKSSRIYYKAHGFGVWLDRAKTPEERHIVHYYNANNSAHNAVQTSFEVLGFSPEEAHNARTAARALKKWYGLTAYEFCPPRDLLERLERFIEA